MKAQIYPAIYQWVGGYQQCDAYFRVFLAQVCCLKQRIPSTTLVCLSCSNCAHLKDSRCKVCLVLRNFRGHCYPLNWTILFKLEKATHFSYEQDWLLSPQLLCWTQPTVEARGQYVTRCCRFIWWLCLCPCFSPVWSDFGSAYLSSKRERAGCVVYRECDAVMQSWKNGLHLYSALQHLHCTPEHFPSAPNLPLHAYIQRPTGDCGLELRRLFALRAIRVQC